MNAKNILKSVLFVWTIVVLTGCNSGQQSNHTVVDEDTNDSDLTISLNDIFKDKDTCDADTLIGSNYFYGGKIKILSDAQIVKAEKYTHLYPTIWSDPDDDVIQFIYLFNFEYKDVLPLSVAGNTIEYDPEARGSQDAINAYFDAITKSQLMSAIKQVPSEYKNKGDLCGFDYYSNSWEDEIKFWNKIAQKYTPGEFTSFENEPFDISPYEVELVVTFKDENGEFTKIFQDKVYIGN